MAHKDVAQVVDYAISNGFLLARKKRHIVLKNGPHMVVMSSTPSCPYGPIHALQDIKKCLKVIKGNLR